MQVVFLAAIIAFASAGLITVAAYKRLLAAFSGWAWWIAIIIFLVSAFLIWFISATLLEKFVDFER
jgi:phosphotransferase system  glucose/maltose/N-acetylglucosamine-specific IIC component